ncbi:MAG: hypothetical protein ACJARD_000813 [Alphaproteobacteria bacterium]|jgi:hypothetical protein
MTLFVNILTLIACFAAMAYCYVLAKRIHAFHNIKDGVGALIEEMIRTTNDLQIAFDLSQKNVDAQSNKLQDKIDEGVAMSEYITSLLDETQITLAELREMKQGFSDNKSHSLRQKPTIASTLPDSFQIPQNTPQDIHNDTLEDVVPLGFNRAKRKKRHQIILPGEEYL